VTERRSGSTIARWAVAVAPFGFALAGPLLPLLIVFAGTLPAAAPHPPLILAWSLAVVVTLALVVALFGLCVRGVQQFPAALWPPLIAVLVAQFIALAWAIYPKAGLFSIATTLAGFVVLVSAADVLRDTPTRRAFVACYLTSAAVAALCACALSVMKLPPAMFAYEHGRASGTFLQPNELAGYLLFVIPIGLAQTAAPPWLRALGVAGAAAGTVGLLLSVSRAAIISLVLALVIFVQRFGRKATVGYVALAALVLIALATVFRNVAHDPSENASRLAVWAGALRVAERFALTGVGPFGFHLVYPQFRLPEYSVDEVHAHSLPLQLLIEYGVLGLAAAAWFAVAAIREAYATWQSITPGDRERSLLFAAIACGFVASALQNAIDVVTTFLLVISWPMLGLLLALRERRRGVS
jgi:O-antigen ligase